MKTAGGAACSRYRTRSTPSQHSIKSGIAYRPFATSCRINSARGIAATVEIVGIVYIARIVFRVYLHTAVANYKHLRLHETVFNEKFVPEFQTVIVYKHTEGTLRVPAYLEVERDFLKRLAHQRV